MRRMVAIPLIILAHFSCVTTLDQKQSMVNAAALRELKCPDDQITVTAVDEERFVAACKNRKAFYIVKCEGGPESCKVKRVRR